MAPRSRILNQSRRRRARVITYSAVLLLALLVLLGTYPYLPGSEASDRSVENPIGHDLMTAAQPPPHDADAETPFNHVTASELNRQVPEERSVTHRFEQTHTLEFVEHTVERGESLWSIARRYGHRTFTVVSANYDRLKHRDVLPTGLTLRIPNRDGILVTLRRGQTLWDLTRSYQVKDERILRFNGIQDGNSLRAGQQLFVPGAHPVNPYKYRLFQAGQHPLAWPVGPARRNVSSRFGMRDHPVYDRRLKHTGIDVAAHYGVAVLAAGAGTVSHVGRIKGYGRVVVLRHEGGLKTVYAHLSRTLVRRGQFVQQGQRIAQTGSSGLTTGVNLHFEVRERGVPKNPLKFLP